MVKIHPQDKKNTTVISFDKIMKIIQIDYNK